MEAGEEWYILVIELIHIMDRVYFVQRKMCFYILYDVHFGIQIDFIIHTLVIFRVFYRLFLLTNTFNYYNFHGFSRIGSSLLRSECGKELESLNVISLHFQALDEPPYLTVGTDVSAKYRGAFCEAKIKTAKRLVKVKVQYMQIL